MSNSECNFNLFCFCIKNRIQGVKTVVVFYILLYATGLVFAIIELVNYTSNPISHNPSFQYVELLRPGHPLYTILLSVLIICLVIGILCNLGLIWGLDQNHSQCWIVAWLIYQTGAILILCIAPIFIIYLTFDIFINNVNEQWKILLSILPISAALISFYFWIHVKIVYDQPIFIIQPPKTARSPNVSARRKRNTLSAAHVSPVTIYAQEVYTNSLPDRSSARALVSGRGPDMDQQIFPVPYNDYAPIIPPPIPLNHSPSDPYSYNFPEFRVIPPTPRQPKENNVDDKSRFLSP